MQAGARRTWTSSRTSTRGCLEAATALPSLESGVVGAGSPLRGAAHSTGSIGRRTRATSPASTDASLCASLSVSHANGRPSLAAHCPSRVVFPKPGAATTRTTRTSVEARSRSSSAPRATWPFRPGQGRGNDSAGLSAPRIWAASAGGVSIMSVTPGSGSQVRLEPECRRRPRPRPPAEEVGSTKFEHSHASRPGDRANSSDQEDVSGERPRVSWGPPPSENT